MQVGSTQGVMAKKCQMPRARSIIVLIEAGHVVTIRNQIVDDCGLAAKPKKGRPPREAMATCVCHRLFIIVTRAKQGNTRSSVMFGLVNWSTVSR